MPRDLPPPAFLFYVRHWTSSERVKLMSLAERGLMLECLNVQWETGSIPDDVGTLARLVGAELDDVAEAWPAVRECLEPSAVAGRLESPKLAELRRYAIARRRQLRRQGKAGAEKRWHAAPAGDLDSLDDRSPAIGPANGPASSPANGPGNGPPNGTVNVKSKGKRTKTAYDLRSDERFRILSATVLELYGNGNGERILDQLENTITEPLQLDRLYAVVTDYQAEQLPPDTAKRLLLAGIRDLD